LIYKIDLQVLLAGLVILGFSLNLALTSVLHLYEDDSMIGKLCRHMSSEDQEIMMEYIQVSEVLNLD
jgi:hypothetical protein